MQLDMNLFDFLWEDPASNRLLNDIDISKYREDAGLVDYIEYFCDQGADRIGLCVVTFLFAGPMLLACIFIAALSCR